MSRNRRAARGPARTVVTARGPSDLVAAVPYLVGFTPTNSVVVVSLRGPRLRCGLVARLDLPDPADDLAAARSLGEFVRRDSPREVVVLVYAERTWNPASRPFQSLVDAIEGEFADRHVPVREAVYVMAQRFFSFTCANDECCPAAGSALTDTTSSPVAAAYVLEGRSPLASRQSLADRLTPAGPITTAAVAGVLDTVLRAVEPWWQSHQGSHWSAWQRARIAGFDEVARRYCAGGPGVTPDEAGRLLAGMLDLTTRDVIAIRWTRWARALTYPATGDPDELDRQSSELVDDSPAPDLGDLDVADSVERLLIDLAVRADGPAALAPLTLLAMHSWACGNGAQAGVAIDRALAIDPTYGMANLVEQLLRSGLAPQWVAADQADDEAAPPRQAASRSAR